MPAPCSWIRPEPWGIHVVPADAWVDPSRAVERARKFGNKDGRADRELADDNAIQLEGRPQDCALARTHDERGRR